MNASYTANGQSELKALIKLSTRIGSNPLLAQASSGNTSVKLDDELWIKASGKWMIDAEADDFLVSVKLTRAKRCLREDTAIPETGVTASGDPCASIETAMHAVLPQRVVIHVHSINTIAWSVREDGPRQLSERLAGLNWQWIPYTASGTSLARQIEQVLLHFPLTNVLVLGNHGLVICAESCRLAEDALADVEKRLAVEPRPAPEFQSALLKQALAGSAWSIPACARVHALATDHVSRRILSGGVLYPCQAIFLPGTVPALASSLSDEPCCGQPGQKTKRMLRMIADHGVLCSRNMTRAQQEMLVGLAGIVQRIEASAPLRYLTASELLDVLGAGGENYRRATDTNCRSAALMPTA